ncbi:hypothetical protein P691DRAFT_635349, partial [Macrolepiota fuliginosa MF-IS2]
LGRLFQCHAGHNYFGDFYRSHMPSETVSCPCREDPQTRGHILCVCPTYEKHRQILRDISDALCPPDFL